ncbi:hypothetical protein Hanom_Chr10g00907151 [Helianthus anomalus]
MRENDLLWAGVELSFYRQIACLREPHTSWHLLHLVSLSFPNVACRVSLASLGMFQVCVSRGHLCVL